jgi:hypothetical protein
VVDTEVVRLLLPILAVSLGFALGQMDAWRRNRQGAAGARLLLRLEIDDNLDEVRRYRRERQDRAPEAVLPPAWVREAWTSQLPRLPAALGVAELARVRCVYSRLDLVAEHHQRARAAAAEPHARKREVAAVEDLVADLLRDGNPLDLRRETETPRWAVVRRVRRAPGSVRRPQTSRIGSGSARNLPGTAEVGLADDASAVRWARDLPTMAAVATLDPAPIEGGGEATG